MNEALSASAGGFAIGDADVIRQSSSFVAGARII
jgi:hypothetical protein